MVTMSKKQNQNKINKIQIDDNVSLYKYDCIKNDETIEAIADRLDERISNVDEIMEEFRLFALGLKIDLSNFIEFLEPPTIHLSSFITLAKTLAKTGYLCIPDYTKKDEKMVFSFCMISFIYFQFCTDTSERCFSDLCIMSSEAMEDPDIWCVEMLSSVPNTCMEHYIKEYRSSIGTYEDLILPHSLEIICIAFLEKCTNKNVFNTIAESILEDTCNYIVDNNYDFFSITEEEFNEQLAQEENEINVENKDQNN